jgi:hypothetical protein
MTTTIALRTGILHFILTIFYIKYNVLANVYIFFTYNMWDMFFCENIRLFYKTVTKDYIIFLHKLWYLFYAMDSLQ